MYTLISGIREYVTLHGKRDFMDIIKIIDLKIRVPWIIQVGLKESLKTITFSICMKKAQNVEKYDSKFCC